MEHVLPIPDTNCPRRVTEALGLAEQLYRLADQASGTCDRDDCLVFFGIVRDCAHAIRHAADEPTIKCLMKERGTRTQGTQERTHGTDS
jgi:hypothetical protein